MFLDSLHPDCGFRKLRGEFCQAPPSPLDWHRISAEKPDLLFFLKNKTEQTNIFDLPKGLPEIVVKKK